MSAGHGIEDALNAAVLYPEDSAARDAIKLALIAERLDLQAKLDPYAPAAADAAPVPPADFFDGDEHQGEDGAPAAGLKDEAERARRERARGETIADVLAQWSSAGPLVHEPTGIAALDEATGGGPVYGTRWVLGGAPDSGKTAVEVQIGHEFAQRGIHVGFLAIDEEGGDLVTRLAQRIGYSRQDCETREPNILRHMGDEFSGLPIRFYGVEHTIESAAAELHAWATADTPPGSPVRCFLAIDSIQTVRCAAAQKLEGGAREPNVRSIVSANIAAQRKVAAQYRMITLSTSELARRAYQPGDDTAGDMAAAKESGAIEYSARVFLILRSVKGTPDLLELVPVKNKHGRSGEPIYLEINRARMTLLEAGAPEKMNEGAARTEKGLMQVREDAARVAGMLASKGGLGIVKLRAEMKGAFGSIGHARVDVAVAALGSAVVERLGGRTSKPLYLDGSKLTPEIVALVPLNDRPAVVSSRPPTPPTEGGAS